LSNHHKDTFSKYRQQQLTIMHIQPVSHSITMTHDVARTSQQ